MGSVSEIHDPGTVLVGGSAYTFTASVSLPNYASYMMRPGVSFATIRSAVAAALARDASRCDVPSAEGSPQLVGSAGQIQLRINYQPISGMTLPRVGQIILNAFNQLTPGIPASEQAQPTPRLSWWGWYQGYVVDPDTIQLGSTATPPTWGLANRVQSDDPSRNGNLDIVNRSQSGLGTGWTIALAVGGSLIGLGVIGYSAGRVADLVRSVK